MIPKALILDAIDRWVEDLGHILAADDPARELDHLRASMIQARTSIARLGVRDCDKATNG